MRHSRKRVAASVSLSVSKRCRACSSLRRMHVGIGERAVVHQAEILAGREGMRAVGRHRRLGRHARVADEMRAGELGESR